VGAEAGLGDAHGELAGGQVWQRNEPSAAVMVLRAPPASVGDDTVTRAPAIGMPSSS